MVGCIIGDAKCTKFCTLTAFVTGTNFRGVKIGGGVSASCIVIVLSACWLINRALALVPPPSLLRVGLTVTGPSLLPTLVDLRVAGAGLSSGRITTFRLEGQITFSTPYLHTLFTTTFYVGIIEINQE